jgi:hypothetical protein
MSLRMVGVVLLLIGSLAIGVVFGELAFQRLFLAIVPQAALSEFNRSSAHAAFWFYGAGAGVVIFVWALLAALLARLFRKRERPAPRVTAPAPTPPPAPVV